MRKPASKPVQTPVSVDDPRLKRHDLGFLELARKPSPPELKSYYADLYYQTEQGSYRKNYSKAEHALIDLKIAQRASLVADLRQSQTPGTMLDVGCGEGFTLAWFEREGWSVEGIDHSMVGLNAFHPHLLPILATGDLFDLLRQRIEGGRQYDLVWLNNVLEHVADPITLLQALRGLIADGGMLVVTVPNDGSRFQESMLQNGDIPDRFWIAIPDHLAYFTAESLTNTAEATGWTCRDIIGDFPIDFFLLHEGSNYVRDRAKGPAAHQARIRMELLLGEKPHDEVNAFYRALAKVGLGRNLTVFLTPK